MILALIITLVGSSPMIIWLASIRPYCLKIGRGYTPGASWDVALWIDWQEASEFAKSTGNTRMNRICRVFLIINLFFLIGGLVAFGASFAGY